MSDDAQTARDTPPVPSQRGTHATTQDVATPTELGRARWWAALKRTARQLNDDKLTTWAAALTYYGIQSLFPGILVLIAVLRLTGQGTTRKVLQNITSIAPGPTRSILTTAVTSLQQGQASTAGVLAIVGLAGALWSSSSYIGSFMQAANAIYDVPEGRPIWKKLPIRLAITIVAGVVVSAAALAVVLTGGLAKYLGNLVGVGAGAVAVWDVVKWPVLVVLIGILFAILYWAAPNAKQGGFRWVTPGSVLGVVIWMAASGGFALYVTNFASYNRIYGSLAAVIVFLIWLWITNLAILIGAEFNAELQRGRAIEAGHDARDEPYMTLRDTPKPGKESTEDL